MNHVGADALVCPAERSSAVASLEEDKVELRPTAQTRASGPTRVWWLLCRPTHHRLSAVRAALCVERNIAEALGALLGGRRRGGFALVHPRKQGVHRENDEEIHGGRD